MKTRFLASMLALSCALPAVAAHNPPQADKPFADADHVIYMPAKGVAHLPAKSLITNHGGGVIATAPRWSTSSGARPSATPPPRTSPTPRRCRPSATSSAPPPSTTPSRSTRHQPDEPRRGHRRHVRHHDAADQCHRHHRPVRGQRVPEHPYLRQQRGLRGRHPEDLLLLERPEHLLRRSQPLLLRLSRLLHQRRQLGEVLDRALSELQPVARSPAGRTCRTPSTSSATRPARP